jgi:alkanesulfonate monooxygenase SsuD/methylene tetrahydromethanopterin reductase-like flavin-dependent oxidoreductase (luciferase family)
MPASIGVIRLRQSSCPIVQEEIMQIGIGLPGMIPWAKSTQILEWARRADAGPFSSLASLDRLVYRNYESLTVLAAAAAITRRIRLMTTVLVAPLHNPAILAKQTASIDALSNGRLTLGLGVGTREDEYRVAAANFHTRGRRLDAQLQLMKQVWSGERLSDDVGPIGPAPAHPGGPELLIGGYSPASIRRLVNWGDGYIAGGAAGPVQLQELFPKIQAAWKAANKPGKPRLVAAFYCALETAGGGRAGAYVRDYYSFLGPRAENMANALPLSAAAIKDRLKLYAETGVDEVIMWPCIPEPDQVDRLAEVVNTVAGI